MLKRNARIPWKRSLLLSVLLIAVSGTAALAASGPWTVIFGDSSHPTLNESGRAGNCRIYGHGFSHNITGCQGDNVLVADGHCPPGTGTDDATTGQPSFFGDSDDDQYCDSEEISGGPGDTIYGGPGNNAIVGGGGTNKLYGGKGYNYIETGPYTGANLNSNLVYGGPLGDAITATEGSGKIYPGKGTNYIDVRSSNGVYAVYCTGQHDTVYANPNSQIHNCATVQKGGDNRDVAAAMKKAATRKKHKHHKHHAKKH